MVKSSKEKLGRKNDGGKLKWSLLPWDALTDVVRVFMFGAYKYGERNWELGMDKSRLIDAALRHITRWQCGEEKDIETGINHLAHAIVSLLMIVAYTVRGNNKDASTNMSYGWCQRYDHGGLHGVKRLPNMADDGIVEGK